MSEFKSLPAPENPADCLAAVVSLRTLADRLERQAVQEAVAQGWTWAQIAEALGISRQAAHKRFSPLVKNAKR